MASEDDGPSSPLRQEVAEGYVNEAVIFQNEPRSDEPKVGAQHFDPIVDLEAGDHFFARGPLQPEECLCCTAGNTGKVAPYYANTPLCTFRGYGPCVFSLCGSSYRCFTRVGNMTILLERLSPSNRVSGDTERASLDRHLVCLVGPYWPFCLATVVAPTVVVTVLMVSLFWSVVPRPALLSFIALVSVAMLALCLTSCRDPGLVRHYPEEPEESKAEPPGTRPSKKWVFNDITNSWRPRGCQYDREVNAVVRNFDHVCPFTGTAIGGGNLYSFYVFVGAIMVALYFSIGIVCWGIYVIGSSGYNPP